MRLLQGTKLAEAPPGWRDGLTGRIAIDVGSGDGRFAYERARADPDTTYIALDPDATSLATYAFRAARKPARGGVENAVFIVASLEQLPPELLGLANQVYVIFPWGGLLRGILNPDPVALGALASLAKPGASFEIVLCFDPAHDAAVLASDPAPELDEAYIEEGLAPAFAAAGLNIEERRHLSRNEALAIPSSWGRRLLHGRPRDVFRLSGRIRAAGSVAAGPAMG